MQKKLSILNNPNARNAFRKYGFTHRAITGPKANRQVNVHVKLRTNERNLSQIMKT